MLKAANTQIVDVRFNYVNQVIFVSCLETICVKLKILLEKNFVWLISELNIGPKTYKFVEEMVF
ncbi:hypothetical protein EHP00_1628 [Ecytonucleospora hepatopenaei]|uniref:Uncharacterized protein n=1 Tax=Ecytonucleospora hepatopenaei TaxID=646526 RepID=A0A1W0E493_9MICR|nr:hypothetical protein EHP00_1628 [Ecytonucleospora hepatopenaei]